MTNPICEQGDSDAHQLLQLASPTLGRPRKSTGERRAKKTLTTLQFELGWERYDRVRHALEDLEDDTAGQVWVADNVLIVQDGLECRCGTSSPSSVLDTASSGGSSRAPARPHARGGIPRPPSPSSPSSLPAAADSGRRSFPDGPPRRRSGDSSEEVSRDEAPHKVSGRRAVKRRRGSVEDATGDKARRQRQERAKRRSTPVEQWNARHLTDEFIAIAEDRFVSWGDFGKRQNPRRPLEKFYANARDEGVPNDVLLAITQEYLQGYDLDGPPWRPFIAVAPEMIDRRTRRQRQYGTSSQRVDKDELATRYGSRRRGGDPR